MRYLLLALALFVAVEAFATVPEIPGNGVDDGSSSGTWGSCPGGYANAIMDASGTLNTGCDLLDPTGVDQDHDGYTSDGSTGTSGTTEIDCDDTNRRIYPGVHIATGCTGSDYKTCQTSGSYTSCQTGPLCEATGSGVCKYVQCGGGSDANTGTYASPYATLGKVSGGSGASGLPASPYTLAAGDVVYVIGSGTCSTTITETIGGFSVGALLSTGASGTSANRITIKQYPGSTSVLSNTDGVAFYTEHDYISINGVIGSSARATVTNGGNFIQDIGGDDLTVENIIVTSGSYHGDYNGATIQMDGTNRSHIHHNIIRNPLRGAGNVDNVAAINWIDDENVGEGADHYDHHDSIYISSFSNTANPSCWFQKHGTRLTDTGSNYHRVKYGYCVGGARRIFQWSGSGLRAKGIFGYSDGTANNIGSSYQLIAQFNSDSGRHEDNRIEYSTFQNYSMLYWRIADYDGSPKLTFQYNLISDNDTSYSAGNDEGIISIDPYGTDAQKTAMDGGYLASNNNIFYNSAATALNFNYFSETSGGYGPAGAAGANYTFANWQGTVGQDAASYNQTITFDADYDASCTNCAGKGFKAATESSGSGSSSAAVQAVQKKKKRM